MRNLFKSLCAPPSITNRATMKTAPMHMNPVETPLYRGVVSPIIQKMFIKSHDMTPPKATPSLALNPRMQKNIMMMFTNAK